MFINIILFFINNFNINIYAFAYNNNYYYINNYINILFRILPFFIYNNICKIFKINIIYKLNNIYNISNMDTHIILPIIQKINIFNLDINNNKINNLDITYCIKYYSPLINLNFFLKNNNFEYFEYIEIIYFQNIVLNKTMEIDNFNNKLIYELFL